MKTIKLIAAVLSLSVICHLAAAQQNCNGNKVQISKGSKGKCGCHCQRKCVDPVDVQSYLNSGWYYGECWGSCCWIRQGDGSSSAETDLYNIYPNPSSGQITIAFTLSQKGKVTLDLYDITGRYAGTIVERDFDEPMNEVTWDAGGLNKGIYFVKMQADGYSIMKKITIIN